MGSVGYEFTAVIERDEDGRYLAICPALPGCYTEGETLDEARENIREAIELNLEYRIDKGEPIPRKWQPRRSVSRREPAAAGPHRQQAHRDTPPTWLQA